MARHQIIYTSCMRGIDGVNDGQQIFSYDQTFQDSKADDVKSLFTYQIPALAPGTIMSEEIALTMPAAFNYKLLKNGNAAVTLNTYLGRDYMGSAGRFGNHLSHSVICDFHDFNVYPCELYGSTTLRNHMEYEEVNNPDPPEYLATPELTRGYIIDTDSVIEFLGIGDNLEYYKQMVAAMLKFQTEKKRVIICDETENIVKWIAALHYTMPLDIAKRVNFTSYDFDPELSPAQICGVVAEGTHYQAANYVSSNRHYVFDFINNQFSDVQIKEDPFIEFLDTAFSFSYDSLTDFHDFVIHKTTYREANEDYYSAFYLYNLLTEGISDISQEEFKSIISFSEKYLTNETKGEVLAKLVEEKYAINQIENEYALTVLGYMLQSMTDLDVLQQKAVKQMIVDRLIQAISSSEITESMFLPLYDNIDSLARSIHLSIPAELMVDNNRDSLLGVLAQKVELWKVFFIIRIISDYVKDTKLSVDELYPDKAIGEIYYSVVKMVYASGRQSGYELVERILDHFQKDGVYYVNMVLNLEGVLSDLNLTDVDHKHLWNYFTDHVITTDKLFREAVIDCLLEYERYEEIYNIYLKRIQKAVALEDARNILSNEFNHLFSKYDKYAMNYAAEALKEYEIIFEKKFETVPDDKGFKYAREILHLAMEMEIRDDYVTKLSAVICDYIPLEKPDSENKRIIKEIFSYQKETLKKPIKGRLLLLIIGIYMDKVIGRKDVETCIDKISSVTSNKADLSGLGVNGRKDYFDWVLGNILEFNLTADEFTQIFQLFEMSRSIQHEFMEYCCKVIYKNCKDEKNYKGFAEYLSFMFTNGSDDDQNMVGKYLCKLSKQKLEDLDKEMKTYFKEDKNAIHAWENVRQTAANTNPLLNNLTGLFKRK